MASKPKPKTSSSLRRREYSLAKKIQVVRETMTPGASVSIVARRHDINANLVFSWRKMYQRGELQAVRKQQKNAAQEFVPVQVMGHDMRALPAPGQEMLNGLNGHYQEHGLIEIETASGMKVRLSGSVDDRMLSLVLAEIRRRA
ncbi:MAG TPA: transposase [Bryobacteraceae bacterium]|nr:transposase [Bryobacteraceae bacterium]